MTLKKIGLIILICSFYSFMVQNDPDERQTKATIVNFPSGICLDKSGNIYIAERKAHRIRKINHLTGKTELVLSRDQHEIFEKLSTSSNNELLDGPEIIALDTKENLFVADRGNSRVLRVNFTKKTIEVIAGTGTYDNTVIGDEALQTNLSFLFGITLDGMDNLYIADTENHGILKVDKKSTKVSLITGNGVKGMSASSGSAIKTSLNRPHIVDFLDKSHLIIGDSENQKILIVNTTTRQIIKSYGIGEKGYSEDGMNAKEAKFGYFRSFLSWDNKIYFSELLGNRIRIIDLDTDILSSLRDYKNNPIKIHLPYGLGFDYENKIIDVSEIGKNQVVKVDLKSKKKTVFLNNKAEILREKENDSLKVIERYVKFSRKFMASFNKQDYRSIKLLMSKDYLKKRTRITDFIESVRNDFGKIKAIEFSKFDRKQSAVFNAELEKTWFSFIFGLDSENKLNRLVIKDPNYNEIFPLKTLRSELRLPFKDEWFVLHGGDSEKNNYHVSYKNQKNACDFVIKDKYSGKNYKDNKNKNENYFAFGKKLYAPVAGEVVKVIDGVPDNIPGKMNPDQLTGNTIVIKTLYNEFLLLAHLKQNSIRVKEGDSIKIGDYLGKCGNSGNSTEPHLHMHAMDDASMKIGVGLKMVFADIIVNNKLRHNFSPIKGDYIKLPQ